VGEIEQGRPGIGGRAAGRRRINRPTEHQVARRRRRRPAVLILIVGADNAPITSRGVAQFAAGQNSIRRRRRRRRGEAGSIE